MNPTLKAPSSLSRTVAPPWWAMFLPPKAFPSNATEQAFLDDYCERFANARRVAVTLALATWTFFIAWDFLHFNATFLRDDRRVHVIHRSLHNRVQQSLQHSDRERRNGQTCHLSAVFDGHTLKAAFT